MEFQLSHFKSWKMMLKNAALNMPANLENSAVATDWKRSAFIPIPKKGNAKECSNYCTTVLISHTSKVMLKILWARVQQYMNWEVPDVQAGFRKGRAIRDQIANIRWIIEKAREFQKNICFIDYANVWITTNCGKFLKNGNTRLSDLSPEKSIYRSRSNSQNWTWNNGLVLIWERSMSRLYIVTLLI